MAKEEPMEGAAVVDDQAGSAPKDEESLMKERGERAYRM
jgi:hypothetical protein